MKKIFLSLIFLFVRIISFGEVSRSDSPDFGTCRKGLEECAQIASYNLLSNLMPDRKSSYEDVFGIYFQKFGSPPYSVLNVEDFLSSHGVSSKILRFECKDDIFISGYRDLIFYFPPIRKETLGYFAYARLAFEGKWEIFGHQGMEGVSKIFAKDSFLFKHWTGIVLIPFN